MPSAAVSVPFSAHGRCSGRRRRTWPQGPGHGGTGQAAPRISWDKGRERVRRRKCCVPRGHPGRCEDSAYFTPREPRPTWTRNLRRPVACDRPGGVNQVTAGLGLPRPGGRRGAMLVAQFSQAMRGNPTPTFQLPTQRCSGGAQQRKDRPLAAPPHPGVRRGGWGGEEVWGVGAAPVLSLLKPRLPVLSSARSGGAEGSGDSPGTSRVVCGEPSSLGIELSY